MPIEEHTSRDGKWMCPVCGCYSLSSLPYDERGVGSDEICPCCGYQFNYDEWNFTFAEWRARWVEGGCQWRSRGQSKPDGWNPAAQLARVTPDE